MRKTPASRSPWTTPGGILRVRSTSAHSSRIICVSVLTAETWSTKGVVLSSRVLFARAVDMHGRVSKMPPRQSTNCDHTTTHTFSVHCPGTAACCSGMLAPRGSGRGDRAPGGTVRNVDAGSFAVVLKRERLAAGLTQEALAERAALSARAISDLERGVKHTPHQQTIELLAAALRLSDARRNALAAAARPRRDRPFVDELPSGLLPHPVSLVGRERELDTLTRLMDLVGAGHGAVALVAGEPGIGKTRLLQELAQRARSRGWQVLLGRAYEPAGLPPYLPIVEPLRGYLRDCSDDDRARLLDDVAAGYERLIPEAWQPYWKTPPRAWSRPDGRPPSRSGIRALPAIRECLWSVAQHRQVFRSAWFARDA